MNTLEVLKHVINYFKKTEEFGKPECNCLWVYLLIKDISEMIDEMPEEPFDESNIENNLKNEIITPQNSSRRLKTKFKFDIKMNAKIFSINLKHDKNRRLNDIVGSDTCCDMRSGFKDECTGMCG